MTIMRRWQFWLGLAISAVFMYFALRGLHIADVWQHIVTANYWWLIPGIAVYFLAVWARAWRWHYLIRPLKSIPTRVMFPITCIGYMGNNIYPARAGEVLRAVILKEKEGVAVSASLATIIVERIFDGVVMLGFIFINLSELAQLTHDAGIIGNISIQNIAIFGSIAFGGALILFILTAMFPRPALQAAEKFVSIFVPQRFRDKVMGITDKFLGGLASLRSPRDVLMVFLTSIVIWLLETGKYWFVMYAFSFEVSFFTLMLMNGVVNLATTIPSAPGYIGTFDAPGIAVLSAYGVDPAVAASYTLVLHVALWVPITALGAYYLAREGIRLTEARAQFKQEKLEV
jgi:glycosyltransferase 2 family protein